MAVTPGSRLGPYEVEELLGSGGTGEVYRARDPRLEREVAIKVLPEEIANRDRLRRFEREARAAGALNHPNVLAVYDIGTEEGAPYVVSELLEGHTLRTRLEGGALPVRKAVDLALQIVQGLAAAHDKGIVHRDLKPENVFLTEDGRAKILDFGLAKLTRPGPLLEGDERTANRRTESGAILGTVGYMSPEQVRGEAVDHRSDIFSFGAVLYEMLSGRRAFRRDSAAETMNAILNEDPLELSATARAIPPGLARIVHVCLEKRPVDRFHSAHDLALAFEAVSAGASRPAWPPATGRRRMIGGAALAAVAAAAALWITWPARPPPSPLRIKPLTSDPGEEWSPALSPDGNLVAFIRAGESGEDELCVRQVDGGGDPLVITSGNGGVVGPTWSPDGQRLAFIRHVDAEAGAPGDGVFVIPALGGAARPLATVRSRRLHGPAWSPDGQLIALSHREARDGPSGIFLLSVESGEIRRLTQPPAWYLGDSQARFSPDGRTLAFGRAKSPWDDDIFLVPVEGGDERRLTVGNRRTEGLDWSADGRSVVFSSWRSGGMGSYNLWRVPASGGEPDLLEHGGHGLSPTISREGARLAYVRAEMNQDVWRVGGPSAPDDDRRSPTRVIASTWPDVHPRYSPDGQQIAFVSGRSGALEVWVCEGNGANPRRLTFLEDPLTVFPIWSPDGDEIAFAARKEGRDGVFVVSASGGPPRRLTIEPEVEVATSWSRDGRWVYFFANRSGRNEVWKVPAPGGDALRVTTRGGTWASESHDGRLLYFSKSTAAGGPPGVWRMPRDGGPEVQVHDRAVSSFWALLEEGILYVDFDAEPPTLALFHVATGEVSRVAVPEHGPAAPGLSVSPDGRWVLYAGAEPSEADVMLVEGFR